MQCLSLQLPHPVFSSQSLSSLYRVKDLYTPYVFTIHNISLLTHHQWTLQTYHPTRSPGPTASVQHTRSRHAVCDQTPPARGLHETSMNSYSLPGASSAPTDLPLMSRTETRLMGVSDWSTSRPRHAVKKYIYLIFPTTCSRNCCALN